MQETSKGGTQCQNSTARGMCKASRSTAHRPGQPIFFPYKGMTFNSCEEAREYYNLYSWEIGFDIRYDRNSTNIKGYVTRQDLVCSCEVCKSVNHTVIPFWLQVWCCSLHSLCHVAPHQKMKPPFKPQRINLNHKHCRTDLSTRPLNGQIAKQW
jgi:hypothetical protein